MTEYLEFKHLFNKPKTSVYAVLSKSSGKEIGRIFWDTCWRQYCFFPVSETKWSRGCMKQIINFIQTLMDARK